MANTADTLPGTGVNTQETGGVDWLDPGKITAEDSDPATCAMFVSGAYSDFLDGKSFGFSIPAGDTIDGIRLRIRKATTGPGAWNYRDKSIRLLKAGVAHGDDKQANQNWNWGGTYIWHTFGGAADLWGANWTPADINGATFGARVQIYADGNVSGIIPYCDCVRITVYYTEGPPPSGGAGSARSQERTILLGM